jgi:thioredoxin reductase
MSFPRLKGMGTVGQRECEFLTFLLVDDFENAEWFRFHCLFCHGYEERGAESVGVLAIGDCAAPGPALHVANYALRLSKKVTLYTNSVIGVASALESALDKLKPESKSRKNITINDERIAKLVKLEKEAEVEIVMEDGEKIVEGFLAHKPVAKLNGDWVEQLGLETTEQGMMKVNFPFNETSVSGVFAAGDCGTMLQSVTASIAMGGAVAAGVAAQLEAED